LFIRQTIGLGGDQEDVPDDQLTLAGKHGFGLNCEQEVMQNVGLCSRLGWNDGHEETWTFTDPAFNQARGPVSVFAARLHWEF